MGFIQNYLSFEIVNMNNCKLIGFMDTSKYADSDNVEGKVLQITIPGFEDVVELNYFQSSITILNSNLLKITNVSSPTFYQELPDGLYTAKISICPFEDNWFQKSWYRTCQLECKYYKAFLLLNLNDCTSCYNKNKAEKLNTAWMYMQGITGNVKDGNFSNATKLYNVANNILDKLLDCDDCE